MARKYCSPHWLYHHKKYYLLTYTVCKITYYIVKIVYYKYHHNIKIVVLTQANVTVLSGLQLHRYTPYAVNQISSKYNSDTIQCIVGVT